MSAIFAYLQELCVIIYNTIPNWSSQHLDDYNGKFLGLCNVNSLQELKVHFQLRAIAIRLYEKVIAKFKNNEGWKIDINCNIGVKRSFPLYPTLFGIQIDRLKKCLKKQVVLVQSQLGQLSSSYFMLMILFLWKGIPLILTSN